MGCGGGCDKKRVRFRVYFVAADRVEIVRHSAAQLLNRWRLIFTALRRVHKTFEMSLHKHVAAMSVLPGGWTYHTHFPARIAPLIANSCFMSHHNDDSGVS